MLYSEDTTFMASTYVIVESICIKNLIKKFTFKGDQPYMYKNIATSTLSNSHF